MGDVWTYTMALASIVNFFMPMSMAIDPNCDLYQDMVLGQQYYIYNSEYPNYYYGSRSCRWYAVSPAGTKIVLACENIDLPPSTNCVNDRVAVSLSGNSNFADARNYCGKGTLTLVTDSNRLAVGLFSQQNSNGGRFVCSMTAINDGSQTTTTTVRPNTCDCGWQQAIRIVGGQETAVHEFPSMAGLIDLQARNLYCGSTIISDRYILTAAHCCSNRQAMNIGILVGDHNITSGTDSDVSALYQAERYLIHPNYNEQQQLNDIAIIRTSKQMSFGLYVGPVCLPFRYTTFNFVAQSVIATGWGQLEQTGPTSETLQKVSLSVIQNTDCQNALKENVITQNQVCTYAPEKDACQSDSGGPLFWKDPSTRRLQLLGIISSGVGCATQLPGINTRVTSYLSWIIQATSEASYCIK